MKPFVPYSLLLAAAATGMAFGQAYTTPVGYTTKVLAPNQFNLVGLTLQNPVVSAGILDAESANSVTDTGVNFSTLLTAGRTYILELSNGLIQEVTAFDANGVLTTPDNITASVTPGTTTYTLRQAATVAQVFGATNSAGLTPDADGDYTTGNDLILIVTGPGTFKTVYYYNDGTTTGYFDADGNDATNAPIVYADSLLVQRVAGAPLDLVVSGEVKKVPTAGVLTPGFNYVNGVAPTSLTLGTSGLQNFITPDTVGDYLAVDNVYIPQPGGLYKIAYYYNDGTTTGWFDADGNDATTQPLDGGFLVLNRGALKPFTVSVPTGYSSL